MMPVDEVNNSTSLSNSKQLLIFWGARRSSSEELFVVRSVKSDGV